MREHPQQLAEIEIIAIMPDGNEAYDLQWEVLPFAAALGPFNFTVSSSGSPEGPWTPVGTNLGNVYTYTDSTPLIIGQNKVVYYRVTSGALSSRPTSPFTHMERQKVLIRRKMISDELVMLKKGNGVLVAILKRKHWGPRCTHCIDPKTLRILVKNCLACYGTTFDGGYFPPVDVWGKLGPSSPGTDFTTDTSTPEVETEQAFLLPFPLVRRGDILVEKAVNIRWEIVSEQPTQLRRNPVHQDINLSRLAPPNIIYQIPVT